MGLFNFIATAGEKIGDFVTGDGKAEDAIKNRIQQLNLNIENLDVDVDGKRATLYGTAPSNDVREKAILAAGNIEGIAEVDAKISVAQTASNTPNITSGTAPQQSSQDNQPQPTFYQVQSGDTLSKIAKKFYGDSGRYQEIFQANQPMLSDPDKIYPGQTLRIPNSQQAVAA